MSSTRRAENGPDYLRDERYSSSLELNHAINATAVAKRCAVLADRGMVELLWFIQYISMKPAEQGEPAGLDYLARELVHHFPERVGSAFFRSIAAKAAGALRPEQCCRIDHDLNCSPAIPYGVHEDNWAPVIFSLESARQRYAEKALDELPPLLRSVCVDPQSNFETGLRHFHGLRDALIEYRGKIMREVDQNTAATSIARKIGDVFGYIYDRGGIGLVEGDPGLGKSHAAQNLCHKAPGLMRYVRLPSGTGEKDFFTAIAEALGVARGSAYSKNRVRAGVDSLLKRSKIGLVIDEAHLLWPEVRRPSRTPLRVEWVLEMCDAGVPIVLMALPKFSRWREHYVKTTMWEDIQLERRIKRYQRLPARLSEEDFSILAKHYFPGASSKKLELVVRYALQHNELNASAVAQALESAQYRARQAGRSEILGEDLVAALRADEDAGQSRFSLPGASLTEESDANRPESRAVIRREERADKRREEKAPKLGQHPAEAPQRSRNTPATFSRPHDETDTPNPALVRMRPPVVNTY